MHSTHDHHTCQRGNRHPNASDPAPPYLKRHNRQTRCFLPPPSGMRRRKPSRINITSDQHVDDPSDDSDGEEGEPKRRRTHSTSEHNVDNPSNNNSGEGGAGLSKGKGKAKALTGPKYQGCDTCPHGTCNGQKDSEGRFPRYDKPWGIAFPVCSECKDLKQTCLCWIALTSKVELALRIVMRHVENFVEFRLCPPPSIISNDERKQKINSSSSSTSSSLMDTTTILKVGLAAKKKLLFLVMHEEHRKRKDVQRAIDSCRYAGDVHQELADDNIRDALTQVLMHLWCWMDAATKYFKSTDREKFKFYFEQTKDAWNNGMTTYEFCFQEEKKQRDKYINKKIEHVYEHLQRHSQTFMLEEPDTALDLATQLQKLAQAAKGQSTSGTGKPSTSKSGEDTAEPDENYLGQAKQNGATFSLFQNLTSEGSVPTTSSVPMPSRPGAQDDSGTSMPNSFPPHALSSEPGNVGLPSSLDNLMNSLPGLDCGQPDRQGEFAGISTCLPNDIDNSLSSFEGQMNATTVSSLHSDEQQKNTAYPALYSDDWIVNPLNIP